MMNKQIDRIAGILCELVLLFRRDGPAIDFNWWNSNSPRSIFYPMYGYEDGEPLFKLVVQGIMELNTEMLSQHNVETKLMYDFLQIQTISGTEHLDEKALFKEARKFVYGLTEFKAWQDIDVPIDNLWLEGEPFQLGTVLFMNITDEELKTWIDKAPVKWEKKSSEPQVIARVKAPGDQHKAISYTQTQVNQALDIFRALCFPFIVRHPLSGQDISWQLGVVGYITPFGSTPLRINKKPFTAIVGSGARHIRLEKDLSSKLPLKYWTLINKLITKKNYTKMEEKLLNCIHWLSAATKPDTRSAKYTKICIAMENLLGGEPEDEDLKVRGITAMLAERAAFIAGIDLDDRISIDKNIRKYYGKRSSIVHGDETEVSLDDINEFGELVRRLTLAVLVKLDESGSALSSVEKLQDWVRVQKYTLVENREVPNVRVEG